jgi:alpha-acetolactate decarboxylase
MQKTVFLALLALPFVPLCLPGCQPKEQKTISAENELDAARLFIRSALDGKFDEAKTYMVQDSVNKSYLDIAAQFYQKLPVTEKDNYKGSTIVIHSSTNLNDSVAVVIYSNSYKNDHDTLRIAKSNGAWLVDLKYLYEHDQP